MAIDPVCGMEVDEASAPARSEYGGKTYYFCAPGCKRAFDRDPEKFVGEHQGGAHGGHGHGGHGHHGRHHRHRRGHGCC